MGGIVRSVFSDGGAGEAKAARKAGNQAMRLQREAADLWRNLAVPEIEYTPYEWLADYQPEVYDAWVGEVTQMSDDPDARRVQMAALDRLMQRGVGGLTEGDRIGLNQIANRQQAAGSSAYQSALDSLRTRGLAGSGADLAARLSANQVAANSAADLYDNAFKTALDRAVTADAQAGSLATAARGQTADISQRMANINNDFNARVQQLRTQAAKDAAGARNAAQMYNLEGRQTTANANIDRVGATQQQNYQNQMAKVGGTSNALTGNANALYAQQAALNKQSLGEAQEQRANVGMIIDGAKSIWGG